ncbi:MarR family transcriptional regulator [Sphingomonas sp. ASV193]|uniref:MarR family winged helix-turn-helix transcriptional regulator n=1 Tax=Sphingomonas sp. ASV193 TaxID=3144405 RepID=UPI0032E889BE
MWGNNSPAALAARFAGLVERLGGDVGAARAVGQQRELLEAVHQLEPATLNQVADRVGRGAPAVSRAVDALVRAGLVERQADPDHRRRLALRLTEQGHQVLGRPSAGDAKLEGKLAKLAASELRALERGLEILERLPR